jgi:CheY-like chemotaxis protein
MVLMPQRILVVNDTKEILELFREILAEEGYEVFLYSYGIQDLDEVERVAPDLIILDYITQREEPGWQLLQKLKMRRSTASIPVVICTTAVKLTEELQGHLTTKGVAVVHKPFDIDDLVRAVQQAMVLYQDAVDGAPASDVEASGP